MDNFFAHAWENLVGRIDGPLSFRLVLQPIMATIFAVRAGMQDARTGRPPYGWAVLTDHANRPELLRDAWKGVGRVFIFAVVMDVIYQVIVFRWIHPVGALIVAFFLAGVPYLVLRGPVNRLMRRRRVEEHLT